MAKGETALIDSNILAFTTNAPNQVVQYDVTEAPIFGEVRLLQGSLFLSYRLSVRLRYKSVANTNDL